MYQERIIPCDARFAVSALRGQAVLQYLTSHVDAYEIRMRRHGGLTFIDCGENLERVACPVCRAQLDVAWWSSAMSEAENEQGLFEDLSVVLPCCGANSSLDQLAYNLECGFAQTEFVVTDAREDISDDVLLEVGRLLGHPVRVIRARY